MKKKMVSVLLVAAMIVGTIIPTWAAQVSPQKTYEKTTEIIKAGSKEFSWGGGDLNSQDWEILALGRTGEIRASDVTNYVASLNAEAEAIIQRGDLSEMARAVLVQRALGQESGTMESSLSQAVLEKTFTPSDFVNQAIWALLALQNGGTEYNEACEKLVAYLLQRQHENGAWGDYNYDATWQRDLTNPSDEVDYTAEALMALAPYEKEHKEAIQAALLWLKGQQQEDGLFTYWGSPSLEATAEVAIALTTLKKDPTNWNGKNMITALCRYGQEDGSFRVNDWDNDYTTCEVYRALAAYLRFRRSMDGLYAMQDGIPSKALQWTVHHRTEETEAPRDSTVTAAQTGDTGMMVYMGLSLAAVTGMGWTAKRRQ